MVGQGELWCLRCFPKPGELKQADRQMTEQFDINDGCNDLENSIEVLLRGSVMVVEAEDQSDREGLYFVKTSAR